MLSLINSSLILIAVLLTAALSGLVSEKAGIVNIGINGFMIIGALAFVIMGNVFHGYDYKFTWIFAGLVAMVITGIFSLFHGYLTIVLKADHVISGTAINLLAAGFGVYLSFQLGPKFDNNGGIQLFKPVYENTLNGSFNSLNVVFFFLALGVAGTIYTYFNYTKFGMRHSSVGENPNASDSASINVIKYKWLAVFASGMLSGLAGVFMVVKIGTFQGNVNGIGFLALAIMILGQWRIPLILLGAILFSVMYAAAEKYVIGNIPDDFIRTIPFILSIGALVFMSRFQAAPKAAGQHFDKAKR